MAPKLKVTTNVVTAQSLSLWPRIYTSITEIAILKSGRSNKSKRKRIG